MAQFIENPRRFSEPARSGDFGEAAVRRQLEVLPDDYTVFLNYEAMSHGGRVLSEFDDVVVTPTGAILVLEVKTGQLSVDETGNLIRDRKEGILDISEQIATQHRLILTRLKSRFPGKHLRFKHFLVIPYGQIAETPAFNDVSSCIIDSKKVPFLAEIVQDFNAEYIGPEDVLTDDEIVEFFKGQIALTPDVSALVSGIESLQNTRARGLSEWIPRIQTASPVIEVEAPAGGGKTQLAVTLLKDACDRGLRALYVGFHRNNVERLRKTPVASRIAFIGTWHELARELTRDATDPDELMPEERVAWFDSLSEALCQTLKTTALPYDLIVVDGAEDFEFDWIDALANALNPGGHLYTLRDLFARDAKSHPEFAPLDHIVVRSTESARVSQTRASEMIALELVSPEFTGNPDFVGENTIVSYAPSESVRRITEKALENAVAAGFSPEQIALLSAKGLSSSKLLQKESLGGYALKRPTGRFNQNGDMIFTDGVLFADTVRRFKGLQSPCVIVTELDFEELTHSVRALLYLAMTRASVRLELVMSEASVRALSNGSAR